MNLICKILFLSSILFAKYNGVVLDDQTNLPIENVNILFKNGGTVSNKDGTFSFAAPSGSEVTFTHIGYETLSLIVADGMSVRMKMKYIQKNEIIITSLLSKELVENLHSSISVFKSDEIKRSGTMHLQTLIDRVPNLNWAGGTSRPRYFQIRGIGERSQYFGEGAPNFSIGFVLDDIDLSGLGMVGQTFDVEQVEIFHGAQSTIFGSNALGGLISMRSNDPSKNFELKTTSSLGTDGLYNLGGVINIPYRYFGLRYSILKSYSNGFRNNIVRGLRDTNKRDESINRLKLNFKPNEKLSLLFALLYSKQNNGYDIWAPDNNQDFKTYTDREGFDSQITRAFSLRSNYKPFSTIDITNIISLSDIDLEHSYDGDWADSSYWHDNHGFDPLIEYYTYDFYDKNERNRKTFTHELRIKSSNLISGFYYKTLNEKDSAEGYLYGGAANIASGNYDIENYAAYFQYSKRLSSKMKLKTNFRYEISDMKYSGITTDSYYNTFIPNVNSKSDFRMFGHSIVLDYRQNIYNSFFIASSRGYKSGGINQEPNLSGSSRVYNPEYHDNIELGFRYHSKKSSSQINIFRNDRTNQHVMISSQQIQGDPNSFLFYTANAGKGTNLGLELRTSYSLERIEIGTNIGLLRTNIDAFSFNVSVDSVITGGDRESAMAPNVNGSSYFLLNLNRSLYLNVSASYKSDYYFSDNHNNKSTPYSLFNLNLGYRFEKLEINLWIRNLFDEAYETRGFYFGLIPPDFEDELFKSYGDPRQMGVSLNFQAFKK